MFIYFKMNRSNYETLKIVELLSWQWIYLVPRQKIISLEKYVSVLRARKEAFSQGGPYAPQEQHLGISLPRKGDKC